VEPIHEKCSGFQSLIGLKLQSGFCDKQGDVGTMGVDAKKLQEQVKATLSRIPRLDDAAALKRLHANIH
jgi:hypothetical protein